MKRNFKEAVLNRRTHYSIDNNISLSKQEIKDIVDFAVTNVPSAFNSQSTRIVLLFGDQHKKLWNIVKECIRKIVPAADFAKTEEKVDGCFAAGYGTILFFEDQSVVENLQSSFPLYKDNFPIWSIQTNAMHQFTIWTMLEDAGLGASLQHYNPLINEEVAKKWKLNPKWTLMAQMPFGNPTGKPGAKEAEPLSKRILSFE